MKFPGLTGMTGNFAVDFTHVLRAALREYKERWVFLEGKSAKFVLNKVNCIRKHMRCKSLGTIFFSGKYSLKIASLMLPNVRLGF